MLYAGEVGFSEMGDIGECRSWIWSTLTAQLRMMSLWCGRDTLGKGKTEASDSELSAWAKADSPLSSIPSITTAMS